MPVYLNTSLCKASDEPDVRFLFFRVGDKQNWHRMLMKGPARIYSKLGWYINKKKIQLTIPLSFDDQLGNCYYLQK